MSRADRDVRVQFAHGLESSAHGNKARFFAQRYDACTPSMNTRDFESCVGVHAGTAARFKPDLLVGSSFGGAVVVALLQRRLWTGPVLLLAQAALKYDPAARLPPGVRATLVHARHDLVVPFEHSQRLCEHSDATLVELWPRDDNHALSGLLESGQLPAIVDRARQPRVPAQ